MKQINFIKYALICTLFVFAIACDKDDSIKESIPVKVQTEFESKFPNARISDYSKYQEPLTSEGIWEIEFTINGGYDAKAWYKPDGTWKMTQTKLKSVSELTSEAEETFTSSIYGKEKVNEIYKTERDKIQGSLYTLAFESSSKASEDKVSYVFINDDGLFLNKYEWSEYDARAIVNLPERQFNFMNDKYEDAEIRGYINNSGLNEYFILHDETVKFVFFGMSTSKSSWKETRYELDIETVLPDNVIKYMDIVAPGFVYTNIFYIETELVNKYYLVDKNDPKEVGHYVNEDIGLSPTEN